MERKKIENVEKLDTVILGGGLTGLIVNHFVPSATIVTKDTGGMLKSTPFLFKLHQRAGVEDFLKALGIVYRSNAARIGYYYGNKFHRSCSDERRKMYYEKSRLKPYESESLSGFMTQGQKWFSYYAVDKHTLLRLLIGNSTIIEDEVIKIIPSLDMIVLKNDTKIFYKKLIVTIPAPEFCILTDLMAHFYDDFEFTSKVTQQTDFDNYNVKETPYDYVYFPEKDNPLLRISKEKDPYGNYFFINEFKPDVLMSSCFHKIEYGNLISAPNFQKCVPRNIEFIGRYANWDQTILISDTIYFMTLYRNLFGKI